MQCCLIRLKEHCTKALLVQCWPRAHRHVFAGKQSTQCWLGLLGPILRQTITCTMQKQPLEVFCEKNVFKNFAIFTGKHLCWSLFFNFIKKKLQHECFPVNIVKFSRNLFSRTSAKGCFWQCCRLVHSLANAF